MQYKEPQRGEFAFDEMMGTTSRGAGHYRVKRTVMDAIDSVAPPTATERRSQLFQELHVLSDSEFQAAMQREGMPSRADYIIAEGVSTLLAEMNATNQEKTRIGRVACNALLRGATYHVDRLTTDTVILGEYYRRLAHGDNLYEFMPQLGVVMFVVSLLRAGGAVHPVKLTRHEGRNNRRRSSATTLPREQNYWKLDQDSFNNIYRLIDSVFKDSEVA